jgi:hypothetical protein
MSIEMEKNQALPQKQKYDEFQDAEDPPSDTRTSTSTKASSPASNDSERLCGRCAALDLDTIFSLEVNKERGNFAMDLGTSISELRAPDAVCVSGLLPLRQRITKEIHGEMPLI